jgi:hypothetical protein
MPPGLILHPKTCSAEFRCSACGHTQPVEFRDPAAFDEDEPIGGRNEWAQRAALDSAQRKLDKAAQRAMPLVPCPRCGATDALAVRRAYLRAALPLVGVMPTSFMVGFILLSMLFPGSRGALFGPILGSIGLSIGLSALVIGRGQRRLITEAQSSVRFLSPPAATAPSEPAAR